MVAHDISILLDLKLQEEWRGGARLCGSNDAGREIVRAGPEVVGTFCFSDRWTVRKWLNCGLLG